MNEHIEENVKKKNPPQHKNKQKKINKTKQTLHKPQNLLKFKYLVQAKIYFPPYSVTALERYCQH